MYASAIPAILPFVKNGEAKCLVLGAERDSHYCLGSQASVT